MFWMEAVPSAAFLLGALLIPESPRFLVASGRREDARRVFARIGVAADALVLVDCCARDKRQDAGTNIGGHDERVSFSAALRSRKQARAVDDQSGMKGT